jgi:hypothetical protein
MFIAALVCELWNIEQSCHYKLNKIKKLRALGKLGHSLSIVINSSLMITPHLDAACFFHFFLMFRKVALTNQKLSITYFLPHSTVNLALSFKLFQRSGHTM